MKTPRSTSDAEGPLPRETERLVDDAARLLIGADFEAVARRVESLVTEHDEWRRQCLNMLAAEGAISRGARRLLDSDLAVRVTEGYPGLKDETTSPREANRVVDQLEALVIALARHLFGASYVEWRPVSNTMANAAVLFALTEPGDTLMAQSMNGGANISYHSAAVAGLRGLRVVDIPGTPEFGIDLDAFAAEARRVRPRCIIFGGSKILFPYPVAAIRAIADEVGAVVVYDAAHVGALIAGGVFGDPLREGAHVLTTGTHKIMGGPVGGLVFTNDPAMAGRLHDQVYPSFMQTRDQNKYAAAAYALAELAQTRSQFARQVVANARILARTLESEGFNVVGSEQGYTSSHQVVLDVGPEAHRVAKACVAVNILIAPTNIFGDSRTPGATSGVRVSVAHVTRQGLSKSDLQQAAHLTAAAVAGDSAQKIRSDVADLVRPFQTTAFSFPVLSSAGVTPTGTGAEVR